MRRTRSARLGVTARRRAGAAAACAAGTFAVFLTAAVAAQQEPAGPPDYARDIVPIVESNCLRCHNAVEQEGGLVLDNYEDMMRGGDTGVAIAAGHAESSALIRQVERREKPFMPPKSVLGPREVATLRAWIDAGAKGSVLGPPALDDRIPSLPQRTSMLPAVSALAFRPDGRELAVGGYREVLFLPVAPNPVGPNFSSAAADGGTKVPRYEGGTADGGTKVPPYEEGTSHGGTAVPRYEGGTVAPNFSSAGADDEDRSHAITGLQDLARAVEYSPDGAFIAVAGGIPGAYGELLIVDRSTGERRHALIGHRDYVYAVAFSPDGTRLASCSYDRTVRLWDVASGRVLHVLREHTEAVFGVAFSPDGSRLASASGDRSVKIWDVAKGTRLYTLTDASDALAAVAFHPKEPKVTASGGDKTIRTWVLDETGGQQVQAFIAHTSGVLRLRYSPDGSRIASSAMDATVRIWNAATGAEIRTLGGQSDWPYGLAWSPDGRALAVGRHDGSLSIYDSTTGDVMIEPVLRAATPGRSVAEKRE
jgi:WD40 repeat protein